MIRPRTGDGSQTRPRSWRALADGRHREHDPVRPVGDDGVLHEPVTERLAVPSRVGTGIAVAIVTWSIWRAAIPRGTKRCGRFGNGDSSPRRRHVALDLPEELVQVAARAAVAVGRALAGRAVAPALAGARRLDARDGGLELARALGAPGDMAEPGLRRPRSAAASGGSARPSRGGRPTAPRGPTPRARARRCRTGATPSGCRRQHLDVRELGDQAFRHRALLHPKSESIFQFDDWLRQASKSKPTRPSSPTCRRRSGRWSAPSRTSRSCGWPIGRRRREGQPVSWATVVA